MHSGPPSGSPDAADIFGDMTAGARALSTHASTWTAPDVAAWVAEVLHLPQYAEVFEVQQIDGPTLLELPEDLLETELHVTNRIHRKKIIAHVKLLGDYVDNLAPSSTPCSARRGRHEADPRPATRDPATPNYAALHGRAWDDQSGGSENEDFLSSGGAASLQRSSNGGTSGFPDNSTASGSLLPRKDHSVASANFLAGGALAERAAVRRSRSMDKLAVLQQTRRMNSASPRTPAGSRASSERSSPRSVSKHSQFSTTLSQRRGRPPDGKAMSMVGKRIDAWGELSPSCSRKGSFGKGVETIGSRDVGPIPLPISPPKDLSDPVTSYYYKASFVRNTQSTVIGPGVRKTLGQMTQKSCSPGPAYRPQVQWSQLRTGGSIGTAKRFAYDSPNCNHWLTEVQED